jgi:magnesium transporter
MRRRQSTKPSRNTRQPRGTPPGTLRLHPDAHGTSMSLFAWGPQGLRESASASLEDIEKIRQESTSGSSLMWINVDGLGDLEKLRGLAKIFSLHPLAMEDVCNLYQRPKFEPYHDYYYIVARMMIPGENLETEQLSLFFGKNWVITFQEKAGDCFNPVRDRIRSDKGIIRTMGSDYLTYAILDATIDDWFPFLESAVSEVEDIEARVVSNPSRDAVRELHMIRQKLLTLRRAVWPLRDALAALTRETSALIQPETRFYLRDSYDHTIQLMDTVENYRELLSSLMDVHLSVSNYRLNDIMRVLTVISVLFMPLNFIAGVYGMNFNTGISGWNMPELNQPWGYPAALIAMALSSLSLLIWFYSKGWLRDEKGE